MLGILSPETDPFIISIDENGSRTEKYTNPEEAKRELEAEDHIEYVYKGVQLQNGV